MKFLVLREICFGASTNGDLVNTMLCHEQQKASHQQEVR